MKTKTINVFEYNELSDEAKENAYSNWLKHADFGWNEEYRNSLKHFDKSFTCIKLTSWSVDDSNYNFKLYETNDIYTPEGVIIDKNTLHEIANMKEYIPTGFCADYLFHDAITKRKHEIPELNESNFKEFFREIYNDFFHGWSKDIYESFTIEYFQEFHADDHEYLENGEIA